MAESTRLAKQFWRVNVFEDKDHQIPYYARGSKTYSSEAHAKRAYEEFKAKGFKVHLWTTGPITWQEITPNKDVPPLVQAYLDNASKHALCSLASDPAGGVWCQSHDEFIGFPPLGE